MAIATERLKQALRDIIEAIVGPRIDFLALYPCTVADQAADGRLELVPDDERVRGFGLQRVSIKPGGPGQRLEVPSGARVLLGFEAGDPKRPYAALWEQGTASTNTVFEDEVDFEDDVDFPSSDDDATSNPIARYVARTNDAVVVGHLMQDVGTFAVFYAPDVLGQPGVYAQIASFNGMGAPPAPGTAGTAIMGRVTGGNSRVRA